MGRTADRQCKRACLTVDQRCVLTNAACAQPLRAHSDALFEGIALGYQGHDLCSGVSHTAIQVAVMTAHGMQGGGGR